MLPEDVRAGIRWAGERGSVLDVVRLVSGCTQNNAPVVLARLLERAPELAGQLGVHKFAVGRGQRPTPVAGTDALGDVVRRCPGRHARQFRKEHGIDEPPDGPTTRRRPPAAAAGTEPRLREAALLEIAALSRRLAAACEALRSGTPLPAAAAAAAAGDCEKHDARQRLARLLDSVAFPARTRKAVLVPGQTEYRGFALGKVRDLFRATLVDSKYNRRLPGVLEACHALMRAHDPWFEYTTIQVNKNLQSAPHRDKNNVGASAIIGLGPYRGGELVVVRDGRERCHDVRNQLLRFDGHDLHYTRPFVGTRYTVVFFTASPRVMEQRG